MIQLIEEQQSQEIKEEEFTHTTSHVELAQSFVRRARKDKDAVIAISGYEGEGKSSLGVGLNIEILRYLGYDDDYIAEHFNDYMIYSPNKKEIEEKVKRKEKYTPINADEAIKALYKLNWASTDQKFINTLYALCRKENKISIFAMPRFTDFGEYFRNHRIMFWLHVVDRGTAILMQKDWNPFTRDPWHLIENEKIIKDATRRKKIIDYDVDAKINMMRKTTNFVAVVNYPDIEPRFKKIYLEGKEKFGYEDMKDVEESIGGGKMAAKYREQLIFTAKTLRGHGLEIKDIAKAMNVPDRTILNYLGSDEDEVLA